MVKVPVKGPLNQQGSFGIPPEIQKLVQEKQLEKSLNLGGRQKEEPEKVEALAKPPVVEDDGFKAPEKTSDEPVPDEKDPLGNINDPLKRLEAIGIDLTEDDFHQYLFKGFLSKTVSLTKGLKKDMTVTLKTLTTEEYLMVDKLLADAIDAKRSMTREGLDQIRSVYTLSFGVTHLAGKPIIKHDDKNSLIETALSASEVINALSAGLITKIIKYHMIFTVSMNILIDRGDSPFLKNS